MNSTTKKILTLVVVTSILFISALLMLRENPTGNKQIEKASTSSSNKTNVVLIVIDTLRADHLSFNGYERNTSPVLDKFASESLNFTHAYSTSSWTAPSVSSLLSGLYTSVHGMMPPNSRIKAAQKFSFKISSKIDMLAEVLSQEGYKTAGVSANPWISEQFGYTQGFNYFFSPGHLIASEINDKTYRVFDNVFKKSGPFFMYMHYFDPHDPYNAPGEYKNYFSGEIKDDRYDKAEQKVLAKYDSEIRYVDNEIGKFFEYLKTNNFYDDSLIIVTADHGEQFKERGNRGHGYQLFNEESRIPLIIKLPKSSKREKSDIPVSLVDVFPTILDVCGIKYSNPINGFSLVSNLKDRQEQGIFSEVSRRFNVKAYIKDQFKLATYYDLAKGLYVNPKESETASLFNFIEDPKELKAILKEDLLNKWSNEFLERFEKMSAEFGEKYRVDTMEMSPETLEQLKSLGYL